MEKESLELKAEGGRGREHVPSVRGSKEFRGSRPRKLANEAGES